MFPEKRNDYTKLSQKFKASDILLFFEEEFVIILLGESLKLSVLKSPA